MEFDKLQTEICEMSEDEETWINTLRRVEKFIEDNGRFPVDDDDIQLSKWLCEQSYNVKFMSVEIYEEWLRFLQNQTYQVSCCDCGFVQLRSDIDTWTEIEEDYDMWEEVQSDESRNTSPYDTIYDPLSEY